MLVLTRRANETIRIGEDIAVTVVEVDRGVVRLGITAPPELAVDRSELYQEKRAAREGKPQPGA